MNSIARGLVLLRKILLHRLLYYTLAWLLALAAGSANFYWGWVCFNKPDRADGNEGHCTIDFGGQYLMGRMLIKGHGRDLYNRSVQRWVLTEAYPTADQAPQAEKSDADWLMSWVMGDDFRKDDYQHETAQAYAAGGTVLAMTDPLSVATAEVARQEAWPDDKLIAAALERHVGGPLYPPINAFVFAPMAMFEPRTAYRVNQVFNILLVVVAGLGISLITRGGVWWPTATLVIYLFPGCVGSINLGQNAVLTLAIAVWGWVFVSRGRPGWGGVVWGLLAFKPVWALALFLVPLLSRRWRMCLTMIVTGIGLILFTLPFVGVHSWFEWLHIGKLAAALYNTDTNWVFLSRDLLGIPRRYLLDFSNEAGHVREPVLTPGSDGWMGQLWHAVYGPETIPGWLWPALWGWVLLLLVLELTVRTVILRRHEAKAVVGPPAAFLFLGAWMCCYHFMYYDVLLAALPVLLLFHDPGEYLRPIFLVVRFGANAVNNDDLVDFYGPRIMMSHPPRPDPVPIRYRNIWVMNRMIPTLTVVIIFTQYMFPHLGWGSYFGPPWDTFGMMALWLWCGILWMRLPASQAVPAR